MSQLSYSILSLVLAATGVMLISCGTEFSASSDADVKRQLRHIDSTLSVDTIARELCAVRPYVYERNDSTIDSMYNNAVINLLSRIRTTTSMLLVRCYDYAQYANRHSPPRLQSLPRLEDLAHAFRSSGDYNTARALYAMAIPEEAAESKANLFGNLSMEYYRIGHMSTAAMFALTSDSLYEQMGNYVAQLWTKRLIMMAVAKDNPALANAQRRQFQQLLARLKFQSSSISEPFLSDAAVSVFTMYHELLRVDTSDKLNKQTFGQYYNLVSSRYQRLRNSHNNVWSTHSHKTFATFTSEYPVPIVRTLKNDVGGVPMIATSVGTSADSTRTAITPLGTYIRIGNAWYLRPTISRARKDTVLTDVAVTSPFPIAGFAQTPRGEILIHSKRSVVKYVRGPSGYVESQRLQLDEDIIAGSMRSVSSDCIAFLTTRRVVILSPRTMNIQQEIDLQSNSKAGNLAELPQIANEPGLFRLRHNMIFVTSQFGTLCIQEDSLRGLFKVVPHKTVLTQKFASELFQVERRNISTIDVEYQGDTILVYNDMTLMRSNGYAISQGIRIAYSHSANTFAMISGDRIDIVDRNRDVCFSRVHIPVPHPTIGLQSPTVYFVEQMQDTTYLLYTYGNTVRQIIFNSSPTALSFRYYTRNTSDDYGSTELHKVYPQRSIGITQYPSVLDIVENTVAVNVSAHVVNSSVVDTHDLRVSLPDVVNSVIINDSARSILIRHPLRAHLDTLILTDATPTIPDTLSRSIGWAAGVVACAIGGVSLFRYRRRRNKRVLEQAKAQQLELLREDMHDMIGSRLVRIASLARQASPENNDEVLARIHDMTIVTVRSLRNLLTLMSESDMSDADFYGSMREYVLEACNDARIECTLDVRVTDASNLDNAKRHELLMIISEMLTNTIRHASATRVTFSVNVDLFHTTIAWSDNGTGIDPAAKRGNGLHNIKRRAKRINALVAVDTSPEHGTCYTISIPNSDIHQA